MAPNEIFAEVISYEVILQVKLSYFSLLEVNKSLTFIIEELTNINEVCRMMAIYKFKTFKIYVGFITNFRGDLKINYNFISEVRAE